MQRYPQRFYAMQLQPGWSNEIKIANPINCQTDLIGFAMLTISTRTLFHRYLPIKSKAANSTKTVIKLTSARRAGDGELPEDANVSVRAKGVRSKQASTIFATQVLIIFLIYI